MMKRIIGLFLILCMGISVARAQTDHPVFSSSLGGGSLSRREGSIVRRVSGGTLQTVQKRRITPRKLVLRYEGARLTLTDDQMQKLMPLFQRFQSGQSQSLEVIGIGRDYNTVYHRQNALRQTFMSYTPNLTPHFREITGAAVLDSNDNTVEFIER